MQSMLEKKIGFADYDIAQSFILGLDRINEMLSIIVAIDIIILKR
jgi:hypothetical protein